MDNGFILKNVCSNIEDELENIGFDKSYLNNAVKKYKYKNIKIFDLNTPQANILKQTAISVGADCAVHRETITSRIEKTDCILGGSFSQLSKISQKLKKQPFKLAKLAEEIEKILNSQIKPIKIKNTLFDFSKPYIVGILNLTKNSFSDGGDFFEFEDAKNQLLKLISDGADIIELGAESTKPFSTPVSDKNQLEKIIPLLKFIEKEKMNIPVSIDTRSANVAEKCVENGANIINDVSGLEYDINMAETIAKLDVPIIIQHSKDRPEIMQLQTEYNNLMDDIYVHLKNRTDFAITKGVNPNNIIVDPGIGFGKTKEQNLEIINRIEELKSLNYPVMVGVSRKSFLDLNDSSNEIKDSYSLAFNSLLIEKGVNILRVHNVKIHKQLLKIKSFNI